MQSSIHLPTIVYHKSELSEPSICRNVTTWPTASFSATAIGSIALGSIACFDLRGRGYTSMRTRTVDDLGGTPLSVAWT